MEAKARIRLLCVALPALGLLAGCGNYTITFETADVINAWGDDVTREMLDVDIVCLTKEDAENHPEIVNRTMMSDEWFRARDEVSHKIGDISHTRIFSLRRGDAGNKRDTLLGEPLLSAKDRRDGARSNTYKFKHPGAMNDKAAIVIFGRFTTATGVDKTAPLIIQPPGRQEQIFVDVGKRGFSLTSRR